EFSYSLNGYNHACIGTRDNTVRVNLLENDRVTISAHSYTRGMSFPSSPSFCKLVISGNNPNLGLHIHFNNLRLPCKTYAELDLMMHGDIGMKRFFCTSKAPKDYFSESNEFVSLLTFWNTPVDFRMIDFEFTVEFVSLSNMPTRIPRMNGTTIAPPFYTRSLLPGYFGSIIVPAVAIVCLVCLAMGFARLCHLCRIRGNRQADDKRERNFIAVIENLMRPQTEGESTTDLNTSNSADNLQSLENEGVVEENSISGEVVVENGTHPTVTGLEQHTEGPSVIVQCPYRGVYPKLSISQHSMVTVPIPPAYDDAVTDSLECNPPSYDEVLAMSCDEGAIGATSDEKDVVNERLDIEEQSCEKSAHFAEAPSELNCNKL
ncbi:unnamed protein product, partial [Owenia fusiformis]